MSAGSANTDRVHCDEDGVHVHLRDGRRAHIAWSDVEVIEAYKQDQVVVDVIVIVLQSKDITLQVDEEMTGFEDLLTVLPARFTLQPADWFAQVMLPPFEERRMTLWTKGG